MVSFEGYDPSDAKKKVGSFWSFLYPKKEDLDWIKNSVGEIVDSVNIDSFMPKMDDSSAGNLLARLQEEQGYVDANKKSWQDYFGTLEDNQKWQIDFVQNTDLQKASLDDVKVAQDKGRQAAIQHNAALKQQTLGAKVATGALNTLKAAMNAIWWMAVLNAISWVISKVGEFANASEDAKKAAEGFNNTISSINKNISSHRETLGDLNDRYKKLSKGVSAFGKNVSLSNSEYEEYKNIISQVSDIMPSLSVYYNAQGEKIGFVKEQLVDLNKEYDKYLQNQARKLIVQGDEDGNTLQDTIDNYVQTIPGKSVLGKEDFKSTGVGSLWGLKEVFSIGYADTYESSYTAKYKMDELKKLQASSKEDVIDFMSENEFALWKIFDMGYMDKKEMKQVFGANLSEIKKMTDESFEEWKENLQGKIEMYAAEIEESKNKIRNALITLATSQDSYWDIPEEERDAVSIFLSMTTDDIIEDIFEDYGGFSQDALSSFVLDVIDGFSDNSVSEAFSSIIAEDFKNMPYDEAVSALEEWLNNISEHTNISTHDLEEMLGLEKYFTYESKDLTTDYGLNGEKMLSNFGYQIINKDEGIQVISNGEDITNTLEGRQVGEDYGYIFDSPFFGKNEHIYIKVRNNIPEYKTVEGFFKNGSVTNEEALKKMESLSINELEIASKLEIPEDTVLSWDEFNQMLIEFQKNSGEFTLPLTDLINTSNKIKTLGSMFKELSDNGYITLETLSNVKEATGLSGDEWEDYKTKLLNAKSGSSEFNQVLSDMTVKILDTTFKSGGLVNATEKEIEAVLRQNGVLNAQAITRQYLAQTMSAEEEIAVRASISKIESSALTSEALASEAAICGVTENAYLQLYLEEQIFGNSDLENSEERIEKLMNEAGAVATLKSLYSDLFAEDGAESSKSSSKEIEEYAKANNIGIVKKTKDDWSYYDETLPENERVYYDLLNDDSKLAIAQNRINKNLSNVEIEVPDLSGVLSTSDKNEALDNYLEDAERRYEIHQDEIRYIEELRYAHDNLTKTLEEQLEIQESIEETHKDYADNRIKDLEHENELLSQHNGNEQQIIANLKEIQRIRHEEAERYRQYMRNLGYDDATIEKTDYIQELQSGWWDIQDEIKDMLEDTFDKLTDFASSYFDSKKTILESYYDVTNSIAEAQHEINKELETSMTMYEWLDEETRKLLFNQEDYNKLAEELNRIEDKSLRLKADYEDALNNATLDTIEEITSNYEMQYNTLMKSYEIAKADLEIAKQKAKLNNVLNERNVRMFIDGQWRWVANTQDVIDAKSELADAEYAKRVEESGLAQQQSIDNLTKQQDSLGTTINLFESGIIDLDTAVEKVKNMFEELPSAIHSSIDKLLSSSTSSSLESSSNSKYKNTSLEDAMAANSEAWHKATTQEEKDRLHAANVYIRETYLGGSKSDFDPITGAWKAHADGTRHTPGGWTLMGEEPEMYITANGRLIPINQPTIGNIGSGGIVFNQEQMSNLRSMWDLSNLNMGSHGNLVSVAQPQQINQSQDNRIIINGMTVDSGSADGQALISALRRYVGNH